MNEYSPATVAQITAKVNEQGLYKRRDGELVPERNRIISIEAYVGGYCGPSYHIFIDLKNKIATYKNLEGAYKVIDDRELIIDDAVTEKFCSEMESIRIFEWKRKYYAPVLDGTNWSVSVKTADGVFESSGSNAFPGNWGRFCNSIERIVMGEFR